MYINDIETLKKFLPTIAGSDFTRYNSYCEKASVWIRKEILGTAFDAKVKPDTDAELYKLIQAVVAYKIYFDAIPFLDLVETENGFAVVSNGNIAPASRERVNALRQATAESLSSSIEDLLEYLEEHPDYHNDWKGSPVYSLLTDTYIHTVKDFRNYVSFEGNRLDFLKLRPKMLYMIRTAFEPMISKELSNEIISQLRTNNLSESNKEIIEDIKMSLALAVTGSDNESAKLLSQVRSKLMDSSVDYPAFQNSKLYQRIINSTKWENSSDSNIFVAGM